MSDNKSNSGSLLGGLIGLIVFIAIAYWIGNSLYEKFYLFAEKKPFWEGTATLQVCDTPYYSSEDCYNLDVTLIDSDNARIHFPNGGYRDVFDIECWFSTDYEINYNSNNRFVFCRSWDIEDQQWDFFPTWVNY